MNDRYESALVSNPKTKGDSIYTTDTVTGRSVCRRLPHGCNHCDSTTMNARIVRDIIDANIKDLQAEGDGK